MLSKPTIHTRGFRVIAALALLSLGVPVISVAAGPPATLGDLVRSGKRDSVLAAITSPDVNVNEKAPDGSTALMWATFNADHELVRALLKAGARADVTSSYGATALTEAIKLQDLELARLLLDAGADVNSRNLDNQTALMLAISNNDFDALLHVMVAEQTGSPLTLGELRDRLGMTAAAVTYLVDRMVDAGHVRREAHPTDRRKVFLRYSDHGLDVARRFFGPLGTRTHQALTDFSDEDLEVARAVLGALARAMQTHRAALCDEDTGVPSD